MSTLGVRNLAGYNARVAEAKRSGKAAHQPFTLTPESPEPIEEMPLIVIVIDELADLMMVTGKKIEELIARIAQRRARRVSTWCWRRSDRRSTSSPA
jgi:S-DNA-T family DNA segregation ATPase FtsK/SpoIIIE